MNIFLNNEECVISTIREKLNAIIKDRGRGEIKRIEDETDTSRQNLYNFRMGKSTLGQDKVAKLARYLSNEGYIQPGAIQHIPYISTHVVQIPDVDTIYDSIRSIHRYIPQREDRERMLSKLMQIADMVNEINEYIVRLTRVVTEYQEEIANLSKPKAEPEKPHGRKTKSSV